MLPQKVIFTVTVTIVTIIHCLHCLQHVPINASIDMTHIHQHHDQNHHDHYHHHVSNTDRSECLFPGFHTLWKGISLDTILITSIFTEREPGAQKRKHTLSQLQGKSSHLSSPSLSTSTFPPYTYVQCYSIMNNLPTIEHSTLSIH